MLQTACHSQRNFSDMIKLTIRHLLKKLESMVDIILVENQMILQLLCHKFIFHEIIHLFNQLIQIKFI